MATATGRAAAFYGAGKPIEIKEYPVPEPGPGAALVKISLANVCGSDLHSWRGDIDYVKRGRALPRHLGHEGTGRIAALGEGVTTDSNGAPLAVGDRVVFAYFFPCGRCRACLKGKDWACPQRASHLRAVVRRGAPLQGHLRRLLLPLPEPHRLQGAGRAAQMSWSSASTAPWPRSPPASTSPRSASATTS